MVFPSELFAKAPVVLVIHENCGLNPYIKDVARRVAKSGFIALAPDALHPVGGYPRHILKKLLEVYHHEDKNKVLPV